MTRAWPWVAVALLGAYHGVDPSMGWLFAVGLGMQEHRRGKVVEALFPIAAGHLVSVALVVALVAEAMANGLSVLRPAGAVLLIGFGVFRLLRPRAHPRWVAMRVSFFDLATWSFLMATAHGAGLMLFPILVGMPAYAIPMCQTRVPTPPAGALGHLGFAQAALVVILHTGAMLAVMAIVSIAVYQWIGLRILRSAWINLDGLWAGALIAAGALSLVI